MKDNSRRDFFKTGSLLCLGTVSYSSEFNNEPKWDSTYDVIIVGSGISGIMASIVCVENNLNTLMIEKNDVIGGNTILGSLDIAVVNSYIQRKTNIQDNIESFVNDVNIYGKGMNHSEHARVIAQNSSRALDFIIKRGAEFKSKIKKESNHSVPRTVLPKNGPRKSIVEPLFEHLNRYSNFTFKLNSDVVDIIKDDSNTITGVEVKSKNNTKILCKSKKAVLFATGGYCQDKEFRTIHNPMVKNIDSYTHENTNANSLKLLIKKGAIPLHISMMRYAFSFSTEILKYGCLIERKNSKRFVNESLSRQKISESILYEASKNDIKFPPVIIYDANGVGSFSNSSLLKKYYKKSKLKKFDTLTELSLFYKLNFNTLSNEINRYNNHIELGQDVDFGKNFNSLKINKIVKAPFYAMEISPLLNYTLGGVHINTRGQVIDLISNIPIRNLYAAGEITGGIHGDNRLKSCSSIDGMVYGMIAAEDIILS